MIIVLKNNSPKEKIDLLIEDIKAKGLDVHLSAGRESVIIGLIGDTSKVSSDEMESVEIVESVKRVSEPYKQVNRKMHPEDTIIRVGDRILGEGYFHVMAGPCSVESEEQITEVAAAVKKSGATMLRGGAFKPRTSPYAFQGLHAEGIKLLVRAGKSAGLPVVTEIMNLSHLNLFEDVDLIQVGARNMQNFELLKELGRSDKPVLLKRGLANTIEEWLMSAEYIMAGGNKNIILCERGIRTFETMTRNTLDISAAPVIKAKTHLPVIIDPSHAVGVSWMVAPLSKAAVSVGADGLMIEVHNNPAKALSDGAQSLNPSQFDLLMDDIKKRVAFERKIIQ